MSDSVRSRRRQPTRLRHPWGSPGNNTEVGCHFLLQCMKVKSESEVTQSCLTLSDPMDCSLPGSSIRGIFQARVLEWGAIAFSTLSYRLIYVWCWGWNPSQDSGFYYLRKPQRHHVLVGAPGALCSPFTRQPDAPALPVPSPWAPKRLSVRWSSHNLAGSAGLLWKYNESTVRAHTDRAFARPTLCQSLY